MPLATTRSRSRIFCSSSTRGLLEGGRDEDLMLFAIAADSGVRLRVQSVFHHRRGRAMMRSRAKAVATCPRVPRRALRRGGEAHAGGARTPGRAHRDGRARTATRSRSHADRAPPREGRGRCSSSMRGRGGVSPASASSTRSRRCDTRRQAREDDAPRVRRGSRQRAPRERRLQVPSSSRTWASRAPTAIRRTRLRRAQRAASRGASSSPSSRRWQAKGPEGRAPANLGGRRRRSTSSARTAWAETCGAARAADPAWCPSPRRAAQRRARGMPRPATCFPGFVERVGTTTVSGAAVAVRRRRREGLRASSRDALSLCRLPITISTTITTSAAAAATFWSRCVCLRMMIDGRAGVSP